VIIEKGLTEEDLFWDPDVRETDEQVVERAKLVLDVIFEQDEQCEPNSFLSSICG